MKNTNKQQKSCFIVTRYFVKRTRTICCIIRNDAGVEYTTCIHANGATSCRCKAGQNGQKCYHVKHLQAKEGGRTAPQIAATITPAQIETLTQDNELTLLALTKLPAATIAAAMEAHAKQNKKPTDIGARGNLNGNRGFSLMK